MGNAGSFGPKEPPALKWRAYVPPPMQKPFASRPVYSLYVLTSVCIAGVSGSVRNGTMSMSTWMVQPCSAASAPTRRVISSPVMFVG